MHASEVFNQVHILSYLDLKISSVQIRERLHSGSNNNDGQASSCPSGLHQDGTCSCTLLMTEVSSTRASIARIFVLAEALFEVGIFVSALLLYIQVVSFLLSTFSKLLEV